VCGNVWQRQGEVLFSYVESGSARVLYSKMRFCNGEVRFGVVMERQRRHSAVLIRHHC
jgi:hypothetical protein